MKCRGCVPLLALLLMGRLVSGQELPVPRAILQAPVSQPPKEEVLPFPAINEPTANVPPPSFPPYTPVPWPGIGDSWDPWGRFWITADYLLWFVRPGPVNSPLLTFGDAGDPIPGALGQPGTQVAVGPGSLVYNPFAGGRFQVGLGLTPNLGIELNYFFLQQQSDTFVAGSDIFGYPVVARPFFDNQASIENAYATSFPGAFAGASTIVSHTQFQGYEVNLFNNRLRTPQAKLDWLAGFRALDLNEDLVFQDSLVPLVPGALTFLGRPAGPPDTLSDFDRFHTRTHFYGAQIGGRWQSFFFGRFNLGLTGKLAMGASQQLVTIDGSSTLNTPIGSFTAPGGILAQTSNIGRYYRSVFAVAPEAGVNLGWQLTNRINLTFGYTFIYLSNVVRPGNQIDHTVNPALVPTDPNFGNGRGQNRPVAFHSSDFWAQGLNFGLTYRW